MQIIASEKGRGQNISQGLGLCWNGGQAWINVWNIDGVWQSGLINDQTKDGSIRNSDWVRNKGNDGALHALGLNNSLWGI